MVVDGGGGWSKKKFSDFSQNLHIDSTPKVNFLIFGFGGKLSYGFNILIFVTKFRDFGPFFSEFRQIYIRFQRKKKWILDFAETWHASRLEEKKIGK